MIAFDLDDVICDLNSFLIKNIYKYFNYMIPNRKDYHINIPGVSHEEMDIIIDELVGIRSIDALPTKNSLKTLHNIYNLYGHKPITIITARKIEWKDITLKWLNKYLKDITYNVYFSYKTNKSNFITSDIKYFVEDRLTYAQDVSKKVNTVFLIDNEWNRDVYDNFSSNIKRIKDISEVYTFLKNDI